MSMSNAMQSGVSGLLANSTAVSRVSYNIANASTDGYRRSFAQMITTTTTSTSGGEAASGVRAEVKTEVDSAGSLQTTDSSTDLGISGNGFFVVSASSDPSGDDYMLTRAGSFTIDEDGYLVNAAGLYLSGYSYDDTGELGAVDRTSFADLETINLSDVSIQGEATTDISIAGNLPSQDAGLEEPGSAYVTSVEYYTELGEAERLTFSWQPTATDNTWEVTVSDNDGTDLGSVTITFNDSGDAAGSVASYTNVTSTATAPAAFDVDPLTGVMTLSLDNATTAQTISVNLGAPGDLDGLTQFSGDYTGLTSTADGAETGNLSRIEISDSGDIYGVYDTGVRKALYNIPLAEVANPNGLTTTDNNAFVLSLNSGTVKLSSAGTGTAGTIVSNTLEASNVDIAEELTDLIQIQRAYSSNAKIVTTVDEMLSETVNLKR
ncbi:flagellar hook protein FlgE [Pseudooceanicola nanhaiensis]|uniref:flagellar hook protein FlgE n=1 Tax=Pseudooceanicola nanhaiensis TaxID=375761 RepID=UPI001CD1B3BD|nr:flagellar hook protein FlgE [Pseudooceanicola nanhaiensis]MCA0922620.1 flagellar hook protein FlgE [Pseudooceanicola nanhaiensis]